MEQVAPGTKHVIVGTAGHIDHGKTALVKALTGIDADRLKEEKERGITIDLGFAHLDLPGGLRLGFVDVPGHERFVKNMLAGAGGIDIVLLVVAADESVMPQTREHFDICRLLGVRNGLVALTKTDLVESEIAELARLEVEEFVQGSFLEGSPVVPVSARSGQGIGLLRKELETLARAVEPKNARRRFRLPIDRVFVMRGFGTVVTGTLVAGAIEAESEVEIHPAGRRVRVRGLQAHGEATQRAVAGQRVAVNLSGVEASALERGMTLAPPGLFQPTTQIDGRVELLPSAPPLKHGAPVHFHAGTAELEARVFHLDRRPALAPGESCYSQIRLTEPILLLPGDRFILRRFSPVVTIGGGRVLTVHAPRRRKSEDWRTPLEIREGGDAPRILASLLLENPQGLGAREITAQTGWTDAEIAEAAQALAAKGAARVVQSSPLWLLHPAREEEAFDRVEKWLARFHQQNPLLPGAPTEALRSSEFPGAPAFFVESLLAALEARGRIARSGESVRLASHEIVLREEERQARDMLVRAFADAGLQVPTLKEFLPTLPVDSRRSQRILQNLLHDKVLVRVSPELVFHREALENLQQTLRARTRPGERIRVPEFKDIAGVSRKYAIPLLEYFDRIKFTRRAGDEREVL